MFDGFTLEMVDLPQARLRVRHGGRGSPLLLLHGHPRTHTTWHRLTPLLTAHHTVVCPDLRGFGRSSQPADSSDHANSSKRVKAADCLALMQHLGFDRFAVAGHDRGAYTAFRLALDHPVAVTHLAILEAVPIIDALERCGEKFARAWWHWFFFAQPEKPERAILADPDGWYGGSVAAMGEENYRDYHAAIHDPAVIHGMMEDYRAGLGIDRRHDAADRAAGRKIECPFLCLWAEHDDLPDLYGDVLAVWQSWVSRPLGHGIACGHHMAEEAPDELAAALRDFLQAPDQGAGGMQQ